MTQLSRIINWS